MYNGIAVYVRSSRLSQSISIMHTQFLDLRRILSLTASLLAFSQFAIAADSVKKLDLLIVAGQSNATGFDTDPAKMGVDELDASIRFRFRVGDPPPDEHDSSSSRTQWTQLSSQPLGNPGPKSEPRQYGNFVNPSSGFGPEVSFARKIKRRDVQTGRSTELAVVKAAFSGTSVADDWDPTGEGKRGACYRALLEEVRAAKTLAEAEGFLANLSRTGLGSGRIRRECKRCFKVRRPIEGDVHIAPKRNPGRAITDPCFRERSFSRREKQVYARNNRCTKAGRS